MIVAPATDALNALRRSRVPNGVSLISSTTLLLVLKALITDLVKRLEGLELATSDSVFREHGATATPSTR